jgi:cation:H+ antiporter
MALDGAVGRVEGAILVAGLIGYLALMPRSPRRGDEPPHGADHARSAAGPRRRRALLWSVALLFAGLALLTVGARLLVDGAAGVARAAGLSELFIGLTVLAVGTSVPEVATSLVAALRGQREIAVGNAIGSSLFNLMGVLGLTALLAPGGVAVAAEALRVDLPLMIASAALLLPIFFTGRRVDRWEGGILLGAYAGYLTFLVLQAAGHPAADVYGLVVLAIAAALVTLAAIAARPKNGELPNSRKVNGTASS